MSITIRWDNSTQTIIYCKPQNGWTWDDFYTAFSQIGQMIASIPQSAYIIMDLSNGEMPSGNAIVHFRTAILQLPENIDAVISVVTDGYKRTMVSVLKEMIHGKRSEMLHTTASLEEARSLIQTLENA